MSEGDFRRPDGGSASDSSPPVSPTARSGEIPQIRVQSPTDIFEGHDISAQRLEADPELPRYKSRRELARSFTYGSTESVLLEASKKSEVAYDVEELITLKVFLVFKGSVFTNRYLWVETLCMAVIYWVSFGVLYWNRWDNFGDFVGKEANIRAFVAMFSTLIGLLLCFYTATNLGRWWRMRLAVRDIQEGAKKLTVLLAHGVTNDDEILRMVQRYARASMYLVFASSREEHSPLIDAKEAGYIDEEEYRLLKELSPHVCFNQAEVLWAWLANLVSRLQKQGLTAGAPHYCFLMNAVEQGRAGISGIQTYLETPIPIGYVHLLCWMVKLHNIILSLLMALASVKLSGGRGGFEPVGVFRTAFRAFFMPFLYNAILILNSEVTDPFGGDVQDFDCRYFDAQIMMSASTFGKAAEMIPNWVKSKKKFAPLLADAPSDVESGTTIERVVATSTSRLL